ncbi:MAG: tail fiber domain-containing protein [Polyangiaceae bacterium]|nr:tail fiber domain-containing protein [Polyangiaceae bacterium]
MTSGSPSGDAGDAGQPSAAWQCFAPANCPEPRPLIGSPCSQADQVCDYGADAGGVALTCTNGYWQLGGGQGSPALQWWSTCGDPVCRSVGNNASLTDDAGAPCPPIGSACATQGATCGVRSSNVDCGSIEECSATDPAVNCPISSRNFKENIRYVDDPQLEQLHDEALHIRLATYEYKPQFGDPTRQHLGFIVEDDPTSPAVDRPFDRVDMYGYLSMLVATTQVQEREIAALRRELAETREATSSSCATPRGQAGVRP